MSTSRTPISAQENTLLHKMLGAMSQRAPSEDDRKRLLALGAAVRGRREELGITPAELACVSGIKREQLEAIEAGRPYPGQRGTGHRRVQFSWEPRRQ
jgi:DNA-binding XRE family transcriptional regulator